MDCVDIEPDNDALECDCDCDCEFEDDHDMRHAADREVLLLDMRPTLLLIPAACC